MARRPARVECQHRGRMETVAQVSIAHPINRQVAQSPRVHPTVACVLERRTSPALRAAENAVAQESVTLPMRQLGTRDTGGPLYAHVFFLAPKLVRPTPTPSPPPPCNHTPTAAGSLRLAEGGSGALKP